MRSEECIEIFERCIVDYHVNDDFDATMNVPYEQGSISSMLYSKCWIDSVQWHLEDIVRNPHIEPAEALAIKRRIDASNQQRTDMVEQIDDYFFSQFRHVTIVPGAVLNTESPAWAIDRLSILQLKIYHMQAEVMRADAQEDHQKRCSLKLSVLLEQRSDLALAINQLLGEIKAGRAKMKVYRQMKMYNDASLNPVLYAQKGEAH